MRLIRSFICLVILFVLSSKTDAQTLDSIFKLAFRCEYAESDLSLYPKRFFKKNYIQKLTKESLGLPFDVILRKCNAINVFDDKRLSIYIDELTGEFCVEDEWRTLIVYDKKNEVYMTAEFSFVNERCRNVFLIYLYNKDGYLTAVMRIKRGLIEHIYVYFKEEKFYSYGLGKTESINHMLYLDVIPPSKESWEVLEFSKFLDFFVKKIKIEPKENTKISGLRNISRYFYIGKN